MSADAARKATVRTHTLHSVYRIGEPTARLLRRSEGVLRSLDSQIAHHQLEIDRLRKLARDRAEVGNRDGQASANEYADQKQRSLHKIQLEHALATEELETLRDLVQNLSQ